MKKILLVLAILLILTSCGKIREIEVQQVQYRNGVIYEANQNKPFNGVVIVNRYSNNQIKEKYEYREGKIVGAILFRENGTIKTETKIEAGERTGLIMYYETGEKALILKKTHDKKTTSEEMTQYYETGETKEVFKKTYDEKSTSGEIIKYYQNGNKESSSKYHKNESGESSVEMKKYYENGNIKLEINTGNGENISIEYDLEGKIKNGKYKEEDSDAKYKNSYNKEKGD